MALLFSSKNDDADRWRDILVRELPDLDFRVWTPDGDEIGDPKDIEYVLVWGPKQGAFKDLPNLKCIFSLGAGVDHLIGKDLPAGVPVVRLMDPGLTRGMSEYVLYWVLHHHRRMADYVQGSQENRWQQYPQADTRSRRIGIMGLGVLGLDAANKLSALEFDVAGWSRGPKDLSGIETFHGEEGLEDFLKFTEILVCLLPLTPETAGILNTKTLSQLPEGCVVINAARGGHVVDDDMIRALDDGPLAAAVLDVFHSEPLASNHPFWDHPKIIVTPHVASLTMPETAALVVAENIRRIRAGQPPEPIVDAQTGY
jgi:glyoxylate/hydroxypyruvate reductase A